jgi:hypothetical protein
MAGVLACGAEQEVLLEIQLTVHWLVARGAGRSPAPAAPASLGRVGVVTPLRLGGRFRCAGR